MNKMIVDAFSELGIEKTDDLLVIKKAYAEKIKLYHPEDDPENWKRVHDAYRYLVKQIEAKQRLKKSLENSSEDEQDFIEMSVSNQESEDSEDENQETTEVKVSNMTSEETRVEEREATEERVDNQVSEENKSEEQEVEATVVNNQPPQKPVFETQEAGIYTNNKQTIDETLEEEIDYNDLIEDVIGFSKKNADSA